MWCKNVGITFLPFCHKSRVWQIDGRTDRQLSRGYTALNMQCMQRGKNDGLSMKIICSCNIMQNPTHNTNLYNNTRKVVLIYDVGWFRGWLIGYLFDKYGGWGSSLFRLIWAYNLMVISWINNAVPLANTLPVPPVILGFIMHHHRRCKGH